MKAAEIRMGLIGAVALVAWTMGVGGAWSASKEEFSFDSKTEVYRDPSGEMTLHYPAEWSQIPTGDRTVVSSIPAKLVFRGPEGGRIEWSFFRVNRGTSVADWLAQSSAMKAGLDGLVLPSETNATVAGKCPAIRIDIESSNGPTRHATFFTTNNLGVRADYEAGDAGAALSLYDSALGSFTYALPPVMRKATAGPSGILWVANEGREFAVPVSAYGWKGKTTVWNDPREFKITEEIHLENMSGEEIFVSVWNNPSSLDVTAWVEAHEFVLGFNVAETEPATATVEHLPALRHKPAGSYQSFGTAEILIARGDKMYRLLDSMRDGALSAAEFESLVDGISFATSASWIAADDLQYGVPVPAGSKRVSVCGGVAICGSNPFPCCFHDSCDSGGTAGNCTWYAWNAACGNWGVDIPPRGNANTWAGVFAGYSAYTVNSSANPMVGSVACKNGGTYGHVAWVTGISGNNVIVNEENCCGAVWGVPSGFRSATYTKTYFDGGYVTRTPVTGSLTVHITPGDVYGSARWNVDGGGWQVSGATVSGLPVGGHTVYFNDIGDWDKPGDVGVTITAGNNTSFSRDYVRQVGNLAVSIGPADAPGAGARWRRTGTSTWRGNGETETGIPTGGYTVEFNDLASPWVKPGNVGVTISKNATATGSARYNRPPVMADPGSHFVHVGAGAEFPVTATEPDGDAVALAVTDAPTGWSFTQAGGTGRFRFVASPAQAGQALTATFRATEAYQGLTDSKVANIQVGTPPTLAPLANAAVVLSNAASFAVSATDPENDPKTFSMAGAPQGATLSGEGDARQFSYTAMQRDAGKVFPIVFTATDADGSGSTSMALRVKSPPLFVPIDSRRVLVSNLLVFSVAAADPDGDAMSFSASNAPPSSSFSPHSAGGVFSYYPQAAHVGHVYAVKFRAVDVDGMRTMTVPITVVNSAQDLTLFGGHRNVLNGFGGRLASVSYHSETAGAQGQPVGTSTGGYWLNYAGFLAPADAASTSVWEIVATAAEGGTIAPSGTVQIADGSNQVFSIAPDEYYYISDIEVDGVSAGATNAYEFAGVVSNRTIHALFAPHQTSQGVPWWWLASFGLTNQPWEEAAAMNHGGGMAAWAAWVAGTDPTNPAATFSVLSAKSTGGMAQVDIRTVPGRLYTFRRATNMLNPVWNPLAYSRSPAGGLTNAPLAAADGQTTIYVPVPVGETYIRSEVQRPED